VNGQFRILHVREPGDLQESPGTAKVFFVGLVCC